MAEPVIDRIPCPVRYHARTAPDRTAIVDGDTIVSYGNLDRCMSHACEILIDANIQPGDVVAVLGFNSIAYAILYYASSRIGNILMPLNCRLTESDWRSQVKSAKAKICFVDGTHEIYAGSLNVPARHMDDISPGRIRLRELHADDDIYYPLGRDSLVVFSSGSTGHARGVVLTGSNIYYSALGAIETLRLQPDDVWLAVLPFYHVGGISIPFRAALAGSATFVMPRFDADNIIHAIREKDVSYLSLVPTMLRDLLEIDKKNILATCRGIILGGAGWNRSMQEECTRRKLPILTTYGLTETSSMVTLLPPESSPDKTITSGLALPYRELKIIDESGTALSSEETGRIAVRGPVLFSRYLDHSTSPRTPDGWYVTDDLGQLDSGGYLTVVGRTDSIIISGGENIDLNRIERELSAAPGVKGAVVLARDHDRWGRRPVGFVELSDRTASEPSLMESLSERLPKIMIPDRIVIMDRLPITGSGKYDRRAIREKHRHLF